jgi:hypothetical protein
MQAIVISSEQSESLRMREVLSDIANRLAAGSSFHAAASDFPKIFEFSWIEIIKTGENYVDRLPGAYERWGDYFGLQRWHARKNEAVLVGYYGLTSRGNGSWLAHVQSPDSSKLIATIGVNEENLSDDEINVVKLIKQVLLQELPELDLLKPDNREGLAPSAAVARSFIDRKIGQKTTRHGALSVGVHVASIQELRVLNFRKIILVFESRAIIALSCVL